MVDAKGLNYLRTSESEAQDALNSSEEEPVKIDSGVASDFENAQEQSISDQPKAEAKSGAEQTTSTSTSEQSNNSTIYRSERHLLTFDEDLWDQLPEIQAFHKQGVQMVAGLSSFAHSYHKVLKKFSNGLRKCSENLEKDIKQSP
jgi:hypothetical protein